MEAHAGFIIPTNRDFNCLMLRAYADHVYVSWATVRSRFYYEYNLTTDMCLRGFCIIKFAIANKRGISVQGFLTDLCVLIIFVLVF